MGALGVSQAGVTVERESSSGLWSEGTREQFGLLFCKPKV